MRWITLAVQSAVRTLSRAAQLLPEQVDIRLNLLGAQLAIGDAHAAATTLRILTALRPRDERIRLAAARAYTQLGSYDDARLALEAVLEDDPRQPRALWMLARLHNDHGRLHESRRTLEHLIEVEPGHERARGLLEKVAREERLIDAGERDTSAHFAIYSEIDLESGWGCRLSDILEDAWRQVGDSFNFYPEGRAQVIVYSLAGFREANALPTWAAGLYDGKIRLPVTTAMRTRADLLQATVRHEYTHHVVQQLAAGRCPAWLNEGLAQMAEGIRLTDQRELRAIPPAADLLSRLEYTVLRNDSREETSRNYAWALAATRTLHERIGMTGLQRLLRLLAQQIPFDAALGRVAGCDAATLLVEAQRFADGA